MSKPGGRWRVTMRLYSKTSGRILKTDTPYDVFANTEAEAIQKAKCLLEQHSLGNNTPGYKNQGPHFTFAAPLGPYPYYQGTPGARIIVTNVKRIG